ncbi:MAG: hypothetical protein GQ578_01770 [Desulfuromonadaceae bacterium]|nr:hypothetical protein [Desulfuromonadaceae bacterium]
MARIRTIKPEFWRNEELSSVSPEATLLAIGLLNVSDDEGYFIAHPRLIESDIFPLRELSSTIPVLLRELAGIGYIKLFCCPKGKKYGFIPNFCKHQVINKFKASKIKSLDLLPDDYGTGPVSLPTGKEWKGTGNGKEQGMDTVEQTPLDHVDKIISYLNKKADRNYSAKSKATIKHINARLSEGYTLDNFKAAIDNQVRQWIGTKDDLYLRPATLFNSEKFDGYVNNCNSINKRVENLSSSERTILALNSGRSNNGMANSRNRGGVHPTPELTSKKPSERERDPYNLRGVGKVIDAEYQPADREG